MASTKVFVSYSRHDEPFVRPLAGLIGAAADDAVFLDVASIKPGTDWKAEIEGAVRESSVFVICWCCEAQKSHFVSEEISLALQGKNKRVVPVLFCDTPLPNNLLSYQWVDLRGQIHHSCEHTASVSRPPMASASPAMPTLAGPSGRTRNYLFVGAGCAAVLTLAIATFINFAKLGKDIRLSTTKTSVLLAPLPPGDEGVVDYVVDQNLELADPAGNKCLVSKGDAIRWLIPPGQREFNDAKGTIVVLTSKGSSECAIGPRFLLSVEELAALDFRTTRKIAVPESGHLLSKILVALGVIVVPLALWGLLTTFRNARQRRLDGIAASIRDYFVSLSAQ